MRPAWKEITYCRIIYNIDCPGDKFHMSRVVHIISTVYKKKPNLNYCATMIDSSTVIVGPEQRCYD